MVCDLELMTIFKNWTTHFEVAWVYDTITSLEEGNNDEYHYNGTQVD